MGSVFGYAVRKKSLFFFFLNNIVYFCTRKYFFNLK